MRLLGREGCAGEGRLWDLGRRWRAWPCRYDPRSSEPTRKEEHSAKFLEQILIQAALGDLGGPALLWGGADLLKVTQHLPEHPAHPSGLFLLHQEDNFIKSPSDRRETKAMDSWEQIGA